MRGLLAIPAAIEAAIDVDRRGDADARVRVQLPRNAGVADGGPAPLTLFLELNAARCRWRRSTATSSWTLSHGPLLPGDEAFAQAMARALMDAPDEHVDKLEVQTRKVLALRGVSDWMYRQINGSGDDCVGNLRLGFRCNQDCAFCWQDRQWPEPDSQMYEVWLREMAAMGVRSVAISGGEPTAHPDLPELVRLAERELHLEVSVQTNAVLLAKPTRLAALHDAGLRRVFVSLHAMNAELSDEMTRAPGTHARTLKGIDAALEAGWQVQLNCVIDRRNVGHLPQMAKELLRRWPASSGGALAGFTFSEPCMSWDSGHHAQHTATYQQVRPQLTAATRILDDAGVRVHALSTCGFPPCIMSADSTLMFRQLDAAAPPDAADATDLHGRRFGAECDECVVRSRCLGARREHLDLFGDAELRPVTAATAKGDRG